MTNKEAIRRILDHKRVHSLNEPRAVLINEALDLAIKALEERPQGEWVFIDILEDDNFPMDKGSEIYECSVCGRRIWTFSKDLTTFYPFCHCGADMRGSENEA